MTPDQDVTLAWLNDRWGVATWTVREDGVVDVELDDGDETTIARDGACPMGWPL